MTRGCQHGNFSPRLDASASQTQSAQKEKKKWKKAKNSN